MWRAQAITPKDRYKRFAVTFQEGVRRFVIGGMHIHAGFADADTRIRGDDDMRRIRGNDISRGHAHPGG